MRALALGPINTQASPSTNVDTEFRVDDCAELLDEPGRVYVHAEQPGEPEGLLSHPRVFAGPEMGDAQVRGDEQFETNRVEGGPQLAERPAHEAQVDTANDGRVFARQRFERAVPKLDRLAGAVRPLGGEARVVEQRDETLDGLGDGGRGAWPVIVRPQRSPAVTATAAASGWRTNASARTWASSR